MRIVDVQQILMQEPRVSWKAAQLITHPEFQSEINRQKRIEEDRRRAMKVLELSKSKGTRAVTYNSKKGRRQSRHIDLTA